MRKRNTNAMGEPWTQDQVIAVWAKGKIVPGYDPAQYRKDACGVWIQYSKHGETVEAGFGWVIDHIKPVASGGTDDISNLQPLQWQNNRGKRNYWPNWGCTIGRRS